MIFLSANIPTPGREFYGTEDVVAIREAVMAFTKVCMEKRLPFYFGGHPAITPLVWEVARDYSQDDFSHLVKIYQSKFFLGKTPKEVAYFENIHWTASKKYLPDDITQMRRQMFQENQTTAAVFIGGMDGVIDEFKMVQYYYPDVNVLPLATTGAASARLYKDMHLDNLDFSDNYSYVSIFRKYL
mgnify:CR=1 FL=1